MQGANKAESNTDSKDEGSTSDCVEIQQDPVKTPSNQQPVMASESLDPIRTPETQEPIKTPDSQQPIKTPDSQQPIKTRDSQQPIKIPDSQQPMEKPRSQEQVKHIYAAKPQRHRRHHGNWSDAIFINKTHGNQLPSNQVLSNQLPSNQVTSDQLPSNQVIGNQFLSNRTPSGRYLDDSPDIPGSVCRTKDTLRKRLAQKRKVLPSARKVGKSPAKHVMPSANRRSARIASNFPRVGATPSKPMSPWVSAGRSRRLSTARSRRLSTPRSPRLSTAKSRRLSAERSPIVLVFNKTKENSKGRHRKEIFKVNKKGRKGRKRGSKKELNNNINKVQSDKHGEQTVDSQISETPSPGPGDDFSNALKQIESVRSQVLRSSATSRHSPRRHVPKKTFSIEEFVSSSDLIVSQPQLKTSKLPARVKRRAVNKSMKPSETLTLNKTVKSPDRPPPLVTREQLIAKAQLLAMESESVKKTTSTGKTKIHPKTPKLQRRVKSQGVNKSTKTPETLKSTVTVETPEKCGKPGESPPHVLPGESPSHVLPGEFLSPVNTRTPTLNQRTPNRRSVTMVIRTPPRPTRVYDQSEDSLTVTMTTWPVSMVTRGDHSKNVSTTAVSGDPPLRTTDSGQTSNDSTLSQTSVRSNYSPRIYEINQSQRPKSGHPSFDPVVMIERRLPSFPEVTSEQRELHLNRNNLKITKRLDKGCKRRLLVSSPDILSSPLKKKTPFAKISRVEDISRSLPQDKGRPRSNLPVPNIPPDSQPSSPVICSSPSNRQSSTPVSPSQTPGKLPGVSAHAPRSAHVPGTASSGSATSAASWGTETTIGKHCEGHLH